MNDIGNKVDEVIGDALSMMGVDRSAVFCVGGRSYVNKNVLHSGSSAVFYGCYYIDEAYDWSFDSSMDGIGCCLVERGEIDDGSALDVNSEKAVTSDYPGLKNFNRRKFRLALEKLCEVFDRGKVFVNVVFVTPNGRSKSEVAFMQIVENANDCWTL